MYQCNDRVLPGHSLQATCVAYDIVHKCLCQAEAFEFGILGLEGLYVSHDADYTFVTYKK